MIDMMKLIKDKRFIISVATAAGVFILYAYVYGPVITKLGSVRTECCSIEKDVNAARVAAAYKPSAEKRRLITEQEVSLALDVVTKKNKVKGTEIISISPGAVRQEGRFKVLPIELEIKANYENTALFFGSLDELENSIVTIRSFSMVPDPAAPAKFRTRLGVNMYLAE